MTARPDEADHRGDDDITTKPTTEQGPPTTEQRPPTTGQDPPATEPDPLSPARTSSPEEAAAAGGSDGSPPAQGEGEPDSY